MADVIRGCAPRCSHAPRRRWPQRLALQCGCRRLRDRQGCPSSRHCPRAASRRAGEALRRGARRAGGRWPSRPASGISAAFDRRGRGRRCRRIAAFTTADARVRASCRLGSGVRPRGWTTSRAQGVPRCPAQRSRGRGPFHWPRRSRVRARRSRPGGRGARRRAAGDSAVPSACPLAPAPLRLTWTCADRAHERRSDPGRWASRRSAGLRKVSRSWCPPTSRLASSRSCARDYLLRRVRHPSTFTRRPGYPRCRSLFRAAPARRRPR